MIKKLIFILWLALITAAGLHADTFDHVAARVNAAAKTIMATK